MGGRLRIPDGGTPVATLQTDFIHSASAIGTWTVHEEFEIQLLLWQISCVVEFGLDSRYYSVLYWT